MKNLYVSNIKVFNFQAFCKKFCIEKHQIGKKQIKDYTLGDMFLYKVRGIMAEFLILEKHKNLKCFENDFYDKLISGMFEYRTEIKSKFNKLNGNIVLPLRWKQDIEFYLKMLSDKGIFEIENHAIWNLSLIFTIYTQRDIGVNNITDYMLKYFNKLHYDLTEIKENVNKIKMFSKDFYYQKKLSYFTDTLTYSGVIDFYQKNRIIEIKCVKKIDESYFLQVIQYAFLLRITEKIFINNLIIVNILDGTVYNIKFYFTDKNLKIFMKYIIGCKKFKYNKIKNFYQICKIKMIH